MQVLPKESYFPDFYYYRTSSPVYRKYLEDCGPETYDIPGWPQFWWKKKILGFHLIKQERIDKEPDIAYFRKNGIHHALLVWVPNGRTDIPLGWRRLWLSEHFRETGINVLDGTDYTKKWNERARRARKKFLSSGATLRLVSPEEFIDAFRKTKVKHWYKSDYIRYYKKMIEIDPSSVRQWLCYDTSGTPVAGLAVHDYLGCSVHLVAFTGKDAYPIQGGTGLIDEWFRDSEKMGIKYLSFDQLRHKGGPGDQRGYTEFKENFIEYRMSYPDAYFRVI